MSDVAIRVEGLSKQYRIGVKRELYRTLREMMADAAAAPFRRVRARLSGDAGRQRADMFWALDDVSFEVKRGEVVGIVGRNGAGKSTLLKVLSRISEPTKGYADIYGRVGSLLEVGTGFHPELSGRENIYLNGAILGMTRAEIQKKFDEIVTFAEVERFVETPVKHYSTGMQLRLAFAVAAHLEPEVLLVDEVLAVGDAAFQRKCLGKMSTVARAGRTVLLVSHDMAAISGLCQRALVIAKGKTAFYGDTESAIKRYVADFASTSAISLTDRTDRDGNARMRFQRVHVLNERGMAADVVLSGSPVDFAFDYASAGGAAIRNVKVEVKVADRLDRLLFTLSTFLAGENFDVLPGSGSVRCHVPSLLLAPGEYTLRLICYVNGELADMVPDAAVVTVTEGNVYGGGKTVRSGIHGPLLMPQRWYHELPSGAEATAVPEGSIA